jgi:hypothetical protein
MNSLDDLKRDFAKVTHQMKELHEKDLLKYMGIEGVKLVKENFKEQGYDSGEGKEEWKERPAWVNKIYDTHPNYKGSYIKGSNPIAKQTGKLRDSNNYEIVGNKVLIGTNTNLVPYAKKINEGGQEYWAEAGRTINIMARKYLPISGEPINPKLVQRAKTKYETRLNQIMEKYKK